MPALHAAGVPITINSDDPPLFNTTLNDDMQLLADPFHFDLDAINEKILNDEFRIYLNFAMYATIATSNRAGTHTMPA